MRKFFLKGLTAIGIAAMALIAPLAVQAQQVAIDDDDIGGVVRSKNGPEAEIGRAHV